MATEVVSSRRNLRPAWRRYAALPIGVALLSLLVIPFILSQPEHRALDQATRDLRGNSFKGMLLGYFSVAFLAIGQVYTVVKRAGDPELMMRLGGPKLWLNLHIALSIAGFAFGLLHSGFPYRFYSSDLPDDLVRGGYGALATWLLIVVAVSGVFGRYLYSKLPGLKRVFRHWKHAHLVATSLLFVFGLGHILTA